MDSIVVQFRNAYKKYNSEDLILNNLNMTVKSGTIYGLLGASGCGKTTMLSCILGLQALDSGSVFVSAEKTIGYMPQELGLYETFTLSEVMLYFGKLNGLKRTTILENMKNLMSVMDLFDMNKRIDSMSGGQKRRTSLAVALLHSPSLLILDEPTVGLDPVIRQNIWTHLEQLVYENNTTIIITTHYVEEAKACHMTGFMSNGRLLVESPPLKLLQKHKTMFLKDIFLKLCNANAASCSQQPLRLQKMHNGKSPLKPKSQKMSTHLNIVLTLVARNFLLLWRLPLLLFLVICLPTLEAILSNICFSGQPRNIPFGIINEELVNNKSLGSSQIDTSYATDKLSFKLIDAFSSTNTMQLELFATQEEALESITLGNSMGYFTIPKNFSDHLIDRMLHRGFASNATLDGSTITVKMDNSDYLKTVHIKKYILKTYFEFLGKAVKDLGGDPRMVEIPLKFETVFHEGTYVEFFQYPLVLLIAFLTPMAVFWILLYDKRCGTLERATICGVNFFHFVVSHLISEICVMTLQISLTIGVQVLFFDLVIHGSLVLLFALTLTIALCGFSFGLLFGTIWNTELEVFYMLLIVYFPTMISSGNSWPRESVDYWAKIIYNSMPAAFPIEASRSIVSKGWGFTHSSVWPGFATPFIWILINFILCCIFKRKSNK